MIADIFFSFATIADKAVLLVLALFSILVVGISLERYFFLRPLYRKSLRTRLQLRMIYKYSSGELEKVTEIAKDKMTPEGRIMGFALEHIKRHGSKGLAEVFNAGYLQEKPLMEGSISILASIGANAPYLGLLGTVFGIMRSFHDLGIAEQGASQQTVMAGISVALLATAIGLVVAIPAVILYNYFRRRVGVIMDTLENIKEACLAYSQTVEDKQSSSDQEGKVLHEGSV